MKKYITLDSHCDTPGRAADGADLNIRSKTGQYDFARMNEGGVDASFFAIYTSNSLGETLALKRAMSMIAATLDNIERSNGTVSLATTAAQVRENHEKGILSVLLGMENGDPIQSDLSMLRLFHRMGIRYMTLTHAGNNAICDSCATKEKKWGGLSPFGKEVVREMNRIGMMIDVSHISDDSFYDVMKISTQPVVATHSCCRALTDVPRNMTDEMIRLLASAGGVIQINFYPAFLSQAYGDRIREYHKYEDMESMIRSGLVENPEEIAIMQLEIDRAKKELLSIRRPSYKMIADHIDHAVRIAGVEHVGLGSDFDGIDVTPEGMEDVSCFHRIFEELERRGYSEKEIALIAGENFLRVMEKICG